MDTATYTIFDRPQTSDAKTTPFSQVLVTLTKEQHIQLCWDAHYWKTQHQRAISRMAQLEIEHKCAIEQGIARETALHNELAVAQAKIKELKKRVFGRKSEQNKHDDKVPGATPPRPKPRGQQAGKPGHGRTSHAHLPEHHETIGLDKPACEKCGCEFTDFPGTEDGALISGGAPALAIRDLWEAVKAGLVQQQGMFRIEEVFLGFSNSGTPAKMASYRFRFIHDRVQQAAYELLPAADTAVLHLKIGRLWLRQTNLAQNDEFLFAVVNQFYAAKDLVQEKTERIALAQFNLQAGKKAISSTAFTSALHYLENGLALLEGGDWEHEYALTLDLSLALAQCEYLNHRQEAAIQYFKTCLQHVYKPLHSGLPYFDQNLKLTLESGNWIYATMSMSNQIHILYGVGTELTFLKEQSLKFLQLTVQMNDPLKCTFLFKFFAAVADSLISTDAESSFSQNLSATTAQAIENISNLSTNYLICIFSSWHELFFTNFQEAAAQLKKAGKSLSGARGTHRVLPVSQHEIF